MTNINNILNILYVEDDELNRQILSSKIRKSGNNIDVAVDGFDGIEKVKKGNYQLIFMDLSMPNCDGYTATEQIRLFNKHVIIIALTAFGNGKDIIKRCYDVGMNDFKTKPLRKIELNNILDKYKNIIII
jgi:CheY-like chemotaxis protein